MRSDGHTVRQIAAALGVGNATIDRALKRLVASKWDDFDEEMDVADRANLALSHHSDDALHARHEDICPTLRNCEGPHISSVEDFGRLDNLQLFRLRNLELDHPLRALWLEWQASCNGSRS